MKVFILYQKYFDETNNKTIIGGLQHYIEALIKVCIDMKFETILIQKGKEGFEKKISDNVTVLSVSSKNKTYKDLIKKAESLGNTQEDILIFATSLLFRKSRFKRTISIQHGISWDIPQIHGFSNIPRTVAIALRCFQAILEIKRQEQASVVVCVDHNYVNWYRSLVVNRVVNCKVIPNFCEVDLKFQKREKQNDEKVNIIFARRYEIIRGTDLLCQTMPRILDKYPEVCLTIAGGGSQEQRLKEVFGAYSNVCFTKYSPEKGVQFHSEFDVAIVPTIGSEGTSLSLLEAMSAECAVICTDVGGMSNIVLDGYNGKLISPTEEELESALCELIENKELRKKLAHNGRETVKAAFSLEKWKKSWKELLSKEFV